MKLIAATVILCIASIACAQSDKPTPSGGPKTEKPEAKPEIKQSPAAVDKKPSVPPAPVVTEVKNPTPDQNKKKGDDKSPLEWGNMAEIATAVITGGLLLIACFQLRMFRRQLSHMSASLAHSREAAKATRDTAKTALEEFHATHLPKLAVRRPAFVKGQTEEPHFLCVEFAITNVGDVEGVIEKSDVTLQPVSFENLPPVPPYGWPVTNERLNGIRLAPGETAHVKIAATEITDRPEIVERQRAYRIMLVGWMQYRNPVGDRRRYTAFCRIFNPQSRSWNKPIESEVAPEYDRYDYTS